MNRARTLVYIYSLMAKKKKINRKREKKRENKNIQKRYDTGVYMMLLAARFIYALH